MARPVIGGNAFNEFTVSLIRVVGTYDICTANGDVKVFDISIHCTTLGAGFTSIEILTNHAVPISIMTAAEGLLVNIVAGKCLNISIPLAWGASPKGFQLRSGNKIQLKVNATDGTAGVLKVDVESRSPSGGYLL